MAGLGEYGLWSNAVVRYMIESGAIGSDVATGNKTQQRPRCLFLVVQFGNWSTQRHGIMLANRMLMVEDMFSESDTDSSHEFSYELGSDDE